MRKTQDEGEERGGGGRGEAECIYQPAWLASIHHIPMPDTTIPTLLQLREREIGSSVGSNHGSPPHVQCWTLQRNVGRTNVASGCLTFGRIDTIIHEVGEDP